MRRFAKLTAFSTLILIFVGGLVSSTGSGLAVPDWPNTYGRFVFFFPLSQMVGGILYEHTHRLVASFVGFLTLVLAVWMWRSESRRWLRNLGVIALLAVIAQGVLGGITVLYLLPTAVSVAHGILAQTFFCVMIGIAYFVSREWQTEAPPRSSHDRTLFRWSVVTTGLIYAQLILGAVMRHTGSGLAILDFPLAGGYLFPPFDKEFISSINQQRFDLGLDPVAVSQVVIHFIHRAGAIAVLFGIAGLSLQIFRHFRHQKRFVRLGLFLDGLLAVQLLLAGWVIWSRKAPVITTFHVGSGALLLGTSLLISLRSYRLLDLSVRTSLRNGVATLSNLWESTKPRITALVLVATFIGFYLAVIDTGSSLASNGWLLFHMLLGSAFVAGGAGTLNQFLEWEYDLRMHRTKTRPIPAGKVTPTAALVFGTLISLFGMAYLAVTVNYPTSLLAGMTLLVYLFIYTPLKRKTTLNTLVGAIPGALPPVGGWLAVKGTINPAALILFGILFLWQIPHFFSIARIYRKDYRRAGFKMLPVLEEKKAVTSTYIVTFCAALLVCSLTLSFVGLAGKIYLLGAALVGVTFLFIGIDTALDMTNRRAKRLLVASFVYLPALMVILILDRSLSI